MPQQSKLLEGLNSEQEQAVTHGDGPLLIVAGAGTGKTTVITRRIAYLIEKGVKPDQILALAFGEKAAGEMEERLDLLLPTGGYYNLQISTFHAFGEHILREYGIEIGLPDFKVLDGVGQWLLVRNNLDKFDLDYYRPLGNPTKFIKAMISHFARLKDELITPQEYLDYAEKQRVNTSGGETAADDAGQETARLLEITGAYHVYNKLLLDNSALDFADLVNYTLELFRKRPKVLEKLRSKYQYILVDEFQDTNLAQYELVKLLSAPKNNITVVGDDDQSIYKFRGASISNILHFQKDYPQAKFISLTDNYRSGQKILDMAYDFIQANNPDRLEVKLKLSKKLKGQTGQKGEIRYLPVVTYLDEVDAVIKKIMDLKTGETTFNDFAILARSHAALEPFLNRFEALDLPYIYFANKGLYNKSIILDIVSYFRLLDNYHETTPMFRVLRFPMLGISSAAIIELAALARRKATSLYGAIKQASSLELDEQSLSGCRALLNSLEKHSETARRRSVEQLFVEIVSDLHFARLVNLDSHQGLQAARYLEQFRRRIQDFQNESPDHSLRAFMATLSLELEAGEEGDLEFDPETGPEAIKLMTVHAAKGLEFKYVFVIGLVDKRFPSVERREQVEIPVALIREILPEGNVHVEEERRLFYVAMTRAKQGLFLTSAVDYGGKRAKKPSQFLVELKLAEETAKKPTGKVELKPLAMGKKPSLPLPKSFSYSQISSFRKCPLEYKYQYILKLPLAGNAQFSFGNTIHRAYEKYLKLYRQTLTSADLFGRAEPKLPDLDTLQKLYQESWVDDWYADSGQKDEYKKRGLKMIREFYDECQTALPEPKYLEQPFRLKLGRYYFTGKLDRADSVSDGLVIIDYKTGATRPIDRVDKQQLLIYQWAASEALGEKPVNLQFWFLKDGINKVSFLGTEKQIAETQDDILTTIDKIAECVITGDFHTVDRQTHDASQCEYRDLE